jgi:hypothetical protein
VPARLGASLTSGNRLTVAAVVGLLSVVSSLLAGLLLPRLPLRGLRLFGFVQSKSLLQIREV